MLELSLTLMLTVRLLEPVDLVPNAFLDSSLKQESVSKSAYYASQLIHSPEYVCHAIQVTLFPMDSAKFPVLYYRVTQTVNNLQTITRRAVECAIKGTL